jgi:saccharopine dehydrogenase-like NADP-dependent oxidoreductase
MKVITLGGGKIGAVLAKDFAESVEGVEMVIVDRSEERAREAAANIEGASWTSVDTSDFSGLVDTLTGFDLVLGALPGDYGYRALEAAIEVGLSSILVGYAMSRLDKAREVHIMVGGIPESPVPPLGYTITWSAEGLIDEYVRDVSIVEGGRIVRVQALSGLEEMEFPGVGTVEAFYTDGLRTLVDSFPGVQSMYEKTLRYPGHVEKVKLIRELGFFDEEPLLVEGSRVSPRLMTARLLERSLRKPEVGDLLAMMIEVNGEAGGKDAGYRYYILDQFDEEKGVTAMARTTAYTASSVAGMLAEGTIEERGVIPPERLGTNEDIAEKLLSKLRTRGVRVEESTT